MLYSVHLVKHLPHNLWIPISEFEREVTISK